MNQDKISLGLKKDQKMPEECNFRQFWFFEATLKDKHRIHFSHFATVQPQIWMWFTGINLHRVHYIWEVEETECVVWFDKWKPGPNLLELKLFHREKWSCSGSTKN